MKLKYHLDVKPLVCEFCSANKMSYFYIRGSYIFLYNNIIFTAAGNHGNVLRSSQTSKTPPQKIRRPNYTETGTCGTLVLPGLRVWTDSIPRRKSKSKETKQEVWG